MDSAPLLTISLLVGYLFGSLPLADRISRRHGVDIFASGTGLAGASNVRRSVGKYTAGVVLVGDLAKGVLAVISARVLGVNDAWIILVATATVVGHWHSVFAGFRGMDLPLGFQRMNAGGIQQATETVRKLAVLEHNPAG